MRHGKGKRAQQQSGRRRCSNARERQSVRAARLLARQLLVQHAVGQGLRRWEVSSNACQRRVLACCTGRRHRGACAHGTASALRACEAATNISSETVVDLAITAPKPTPGKMKTAGEQSERGAIQRRAPVGEPALGRPGCSSPRCPSRRGAQSRRPTVVGLPGHHGRAVDVHRREGGARSKHALAAAPPAGERVGERVGGRMGRRAQQRRSRRRPQQEQAVRRPLHPS